MGQFILITGACRSGKSRYALERAKQEGENVLYIATCQPSDQEMQERIKRHQKERPAHWHTLENRWDLATVLEEKKGQYDCFLIDCLTLWASYLLVQGESEDFICQRAEEAVSVICSISATVIAVTNEVGWGVVPESESGRRFRDLAGKVNQVLAKAADEVILMVAGIPIHVGADLRICQKETS